MMKKIEVILIVVILLLEFMIPFSAILAEDVPLTEGDFVYEVLDDGTARIKAYNGNARKVEIPSKVGDYSVSVIGDLDPGIKNMTVLIIPEGVTEIESYAIYNAQLLHSVQLPESLIKIGGSAFYRCGSLSSIELPAGLQEIEGNPFAGCTALSSIRFREENETYAIYKSLLYHKQSRTIVSCAPAALSPKVEIPEGTASIEDSAFYACEEIEEIIFPESLRRIANNAFYRCTALKRIEFADGLRIIEESVFDGCGQLEEVQLPEGLLELGNFAFEDCSKLKTIWIPESLEKMGDNPFFNCSLLSNIIMSDNHPFLVFSDQCLIDTEWQRLICWFGSQQTDIFTVPESVSEIGRYALSRDANLRKVILSSSVRVIRRNAFYKCGKLETVETAEGLETIEMEAFANCGSLKNIHLPATLKSIEYEAFASCNSLENLDLPAGITNLSQNAFYNCENLTITVHSDEHEIFCQENGISYVRGEDMEGEQKTGALDSVSVYSYNGREMITCQDLKGYAEGSPSLLTEAEAMRQILLRGIPLTDLYQENVDHVPCLILEQQDGSKLILEEYFVVEDQTRWVPEESLLQFCEALFGESYDYYMEEPESVGEDDNIKALLEKTESLRENRGVTAWENYLKNRVSYGDNGDYWSFPKIKLCVHHSHRLIREDDITEWLYSRGINWKYGLELFVQNRRWYAIGFDFTQSETYGLPELHPLGETEETYLVPEDWLYLFTEYLSGMERPLAVSLWESKDFSPVFAEIVKAQGIWVELAYETLVGEDGKPFRVRVTMLDAPSAGSLECSWEYKMGDYNTVDTLGALWGHSDSIELIHRSTVIETVPSPAAFLGVSLSSGDSQGVQIPVMHQSELPSYALIKTEPYFAISGEPFVLQYILNSKDYPVKDAMIILEAYMIQSQRYEIVKKIPLKNFSGEVSVIPTEEMESISANIEICFESGITYTSSAGAYSSVGGTAYEPAIVKLHMDRNEIRAGETVAVTYEATGIKDLSTIECNTWIYTESSNFLESEYKNYEMIPASSGTILITPEQAGIMEINIEFVGQEDYYKYATINGILVTE